MATIITLLTDIALGALAYRLAAENRAQIKAVVSRLEFIEKALKIIGVSVDLDSN